MNNYYSWLGKLSTGGNVYYGYDVLYIQKFLKWAGYYNGKLDGGYRVGRYLDGFSGTVTIDDPEFMRDLKRAFNPYAIKKVVANPKKNATTVIFEDGTVEVVKKSPDDPEADIFSVVAYAVAKRIYGSNSAFKREVLKNFDFIDREFEKVIDKTPVEDLIRAITLGKKIERMKK